MDWMEAVVHTTTMGADLVSDVLMNAGAVGTAIEDRYDVTSSKKEDGMWDMIDEDVLRHMSEDVLVKAYFKDDQPAQETLLLVQEKLREIGRLDLGFDAGSLAVEHTSVHEQDWAENWKKYYKPFRAGERLVIKPSWEPYEAKDGDLVLELDPGMAFGTGSHATTRMCLELMDVNGKDVIDVGCGSGILGIAAKICGAKSVYMCDIDEQAVEFARQNASLNHVDAVIERADLLEGDRQADFIFANITADILMRFSKSIGKHLRKGGIIVLSGIIDTREAEVVQCYRDAGYEIIERQSIDAWRAFKLKRVDD